MLPPSYLNISYDNLIISNTIRQAIEIYSHTRYNLPPCGIQSNKKVVALFEDLFYQRLIKLRTEKGVSARDMSLSIGQSPGYINSLENRNGFPSMQVFFYICEYLGVTPAEFFDDGSDHPVEYKEVLDEIKLLSHENLKNVMAIVKALNHNQT